MRTGLRKHYFDKGINYINEKEPLKAAEIYIETAKNISKNISKKIILEPINYRGTSAWMRNLQKRKNFFTSGSFLKAIKNGAEIAHFNLINYYNPFQFLINQVSVVSY